MVIVTAIVTEYYGADRNVKFTDKTVTVMLIMRHIELAFNGLQT